LRYYDKIYLANLKYRFGSFSLYIVK